MKLRLLILLAAALAASPAAGQTIKSLGYNTTNGSIVAATNVTFTNSVGFATNARAATRTNLGGTTVGNAVFTATNAAAAATAIGLGTANTASFDSLTIGATSGDPLNVDFYQIESPTFGFLFNWEERRLTQGTNNIFTWSSTNASFPVVPVSFATNVTVNGNLSVGSLTTTTPSTWALDATQTAAATNGRLTLPSNANVIRLTNNNAISSVTNGVLGAFYYLINQATNAVTISNVGGITIDGAQNLTLSPNESATLVATGPTNASVAARGDLNDVALGGTANTAPSQTASSGASLMTRSLTDLQMFGLLGLYDPVRLASGTVTGTNGGGFDNYGSSYDLRTGTNAAGAVVYNAGSFTRQTTAGSGANAAWANRIVVAWPFNRATTNNEVRLQYGRSTSANTHAALTARGIGIRINGNNMFFETHDGTTAFETTNAVPLTHNFGQDVFWAISESGVVRFYRGQNTLLATVTNNVPTSGVSDNNTGWIISISNTTAANSIFRVLNNPGFVLQQ